MAAADKVIRLVEERYGPLTGAIKDGIIKAGATTVEEASKVVDKFKNLPMPTGDKGKSTIFLGDEMASTKNEKIKATDDSAFKAGERDRLSKQEKGLVPVGNKPETVDAEYIDTPNKPIYQSGKEQLKLGPAEQKVYDNLSDMDKTMVKSNPSLLDTIMQNKKKALGAAGVAGAGTVMSLTGNDAEKDLTAAVKATGDKLTEEPTKTEAYVPTKAAAIERKDYTTDLDKLNKEIDKVSKESSYVPKFDSLINNYKKVAEQSENPDVSSYLSKIEGLKIKADDILKQKENQVDRLEKFAVYEQLAQALAQAAAGMYGLKHNVDMSGIKFNPTDWDAKLKNRLSVLDDKLDSYKEAQKDIIGNIKDVKAEAKDRDKARLDMAGEELRVGMKQEEGKASGINQDKRTKLETLKYNLNNLLDTKREEDRKEIALAKVNGKATPESKELAKQQLKQDQTLKQTSALIQGVADGTISMDKAQVKLLEYVAHLPKDIAKTVMADLSKIEPASKGWLSSSEGKVPTSLKDLTGTTVTAPAGRVKVIDQNGRAFSLPENQLKDAIAQGYKLAE